MNSDRLLLNEIYYGSINAISVISSYLDKIKDYDMFNTLFDTLTAYRKIANKAVVLLGEQGGTSTQSFFQKASAHTVRQIIAITSSESYINGLLIRGSTDQIRDIISYINTCTDAKKETRALAYSLIELEEENIRVLKKYQKFV